MPIDWNAMRSDAWGSIYRFVSGIRVEQWAAIRDQQLLGILTWRPQTSQADRIWLAAAPEKEGLAIPALLAQLLKRAADRWRMVLDYPAERGRQAFLEAGFRLQQTLIWMELKLKKGG
jgi:hypothetical protein